MNLFHIRQAIFFSLNALWGDKTSSAVKKEFHWCGDSLQSISRMTDIQNAPCGVDTHIHLIVIFRCKLLTMAWMDIITLCSIMDKKLMIFLGKSGCIPSVQRDNAVLAFCYRLMD